ncbi:hypothetical protein [Shewanella sp. HL-SH2]|jgi:hypothetical protein|uniref:hypothetical protein n=1 Tax=Shewanella sp. HL-SH2 TaxID=3436238 RepID=UPI003EBCDAEC
MNTLFHNGLTLPLSDAHVYQRRGIILAYRNQEPLHFTILRCLEDNEVKTYFGAARVDNAQDFKLIMDYGDKFEVVNSWYQCHQQRLQTAC